MVFNNGDNSSNTDFELSTGTLQFANRTRLLGGYSENIGIAYNAGTGTFTVQGGDGNSLSATNPGYINIQSKTTPGKQIKIAITANQTFIDDNGSSQIIGNLFGATTGIAITNDIPFFIYAVLNDNENAIAFMISRYPNTRTSPASAKIGKNGSAVASTQGSFFSLANITVTDYDTNPCLSIGSFRMTMSNLNDWTVSTLTFSDGIGCFQESTSFTWGSGLWGAGSGRYFKNSGGANSAPIFSSNLFSYFIDMNNFFKCYAVFNNCTTAGTLGGNLQFAQAFALDGAAIGVGTLRNGSSALFVGCDAIDSADAALNSVIKTIVNDVSSLVTLNTSVTVSANFTITYCINSKILFT